MKAYGKINLTLRVIRKRNDGYHDLQMINTRISLYDTIKIKETKGVDEVLYYNAPKNTNGEDLVLRVLQEFKKRYSIVTKHKIVIKKNPYWCNASLWIYFNNSVSFLKGLSVKRQTN